MRSLIVQFLSPWLGEDLANLLAPTWFTMVALAWIVGSLVALRIARTRGLPSQDILRALFVGYLAALSTGIAGPALVDLATQLAKGQAPRLRFAGMTSWYGVAGALAGIAWAVRGRRTSLLDALDSFALPAGLALCIGRLGCFIAGCDFGTPSSGPWAMRFPAGSPAWRAHVDAGWLPASRAQSLPVHPTQLYEAALGLVIVVFLVLLARSKSIRLRPGQEFLLACVPYLAGRFAIEALRGDIGRGIYFGLSTGQCMSLGILLAITIYSLRNSAIRARLAFAVALLLTLYSPTSQADPERTFDISALATSSASLNRPDGQVPQLGGFTLSGNLFLSKRLSVGADVESLANSVAVHRGLFLSGQLQREVAPHLDVAIRAGTGVTFVDFIDPAFGSTIVATGLRASTAISYWPRDNWAVTFWPATIDFMGHRDLGGSILSYQIRIGVTWGRSSPGQRPEPQPPIQPAPAPPTPAAPAPMPVQPAPAQPQPTSASPGATSATPN